MHKRGLSSLSRSLKHLFMNDFFSPKCWHGACNEDPDIRIQIIGCGHW